MLRVYGCIINYHDLRLVVLAGLICLFSCYTAFSLLGRARQPKRHPSYLWLIGASLVTGCGIWATHFVAMLGFQSGLPVSYDFDLTAVSALIAIIACGLGFGFAVRRHQGALGGGIVGAAIGAMHYVGMAAVHLPAEKHWDGSYVIASLLIGVGFSSFAVMLKMHGQPGWRGRLLATLLLTVGICGMHFTGMAALSFTFDPTVTIPDQAIAPLWFAVAITAVTFLIVGLGLIGALVDQHVAKLEAANQQLEHNAVMITDALKAAEAANHAKSQFLAIMSHELRTPLNAIIGFSEVLKEQMFGNLGNERYRDYSNDIYISGTHLLGLVNDILDTVKCDSDRFELFEEAVNLAVTILDCAKTMKLQAEKRGILLNVDIEHDLPQLYADQRRVGQIVINLLSNAVKFTPKGGTVCVAALHRGGVIALSVSDTGIGIASEDMPKTLERFRQIDSELSRRYEGAGLGLPLSKHLAELHGATLAIESQIGVGTTVTVAFPAERVMAPQAAVA